MPHQHQVERNTVTVSDQDANVTFSDTSGNSAYETVFDLTVPVGAEYRIVPSRRMADGDGLTVRLNLDSDEAGTDIPDSATVRFIAQTPLEEDVNVIGSTVQNRRFNNANQSNADEVLRLDPNKEYRFTEDSHFKIQVNSGTAVDASGSWAEVELVRLSA